jgi:hypothetical protein
VRFLPNQLDRNKGHKRTATLKMITINNTSLEKGVCFPDLSFAFFVSSMSLRNCVRARVRVTMSIPTNRYEKMIMKKYLIE